MVMLIGCHVSFGIDQLLGSAKQAVEFGANTFMFYTGAPQNTIRKSLAPDKIMEAHEFMKEHHIALETVICHAPYIINLANKKDPEKWNFSIQFLKQELERCDQMGISKMVLHPGSAVGISKEEGIQNIIEALNHVCTFDTHCHILLETMAGKGSECGCTLEEIAAILKGITDKRRFGVCLDTCHLNDAGYDMQAFDSFLEVFDQTIGLERIGCIHVNDSKNPKGSHKDRHENIGKGTIGFDSLLKICCYDKLKEVPKILETPYIGDEDESKERIYSPYRFEIEMLKKQQFFEDLYEQIRTYYKKA